MNDVLIDILFLLPMLGLIVFLIIANIKINSSFKQVQKLIGKQADKEVKEAISHRCNKESH